MREIAVRTAGAAMPSGASSRTSAATEARPPRERKWSPKRSNSAARAFTAPVWRQVSGRDNASWEEIVTYLGVGRGIIGHHRMTCELRPVSLTGRGWEHAVQ